MRLQHVVSGVRSIPFAVIYHAYTRTDSSTLSRKRGCVSSFPFCPHYDFPDVICWTYRHVTICAPPALLVSSQQQHASSLHFICYPDISRGRVRSELKPPPPKNPPKTALIRVSESPQNRWVMKERRNRISLVAGESCCAGVQVFYLFTPALIYVHSRVSCNCRENRQSRKKKKMSQAWCPWNS